MRYYKAIFEGTVRNIYEVGSMDDYDSFVESLPPYWEAVPIEKEEFDALALDIDREQEDLQDREVLINSDFNYRSMSLNFFRGVGVVPTKVQLTRIYDWLRACEEV